MTVHVTQASEYRQLLVYVYQHAPDAFPLECILDADEPLNLALSFADLNRAFPLVGERIHEAHELDVLKEMLTLSLNAYQAGKSAMGAAILREVEARIWGNQVRAR